MHHHQTKAAMAIDKTNLLVYFFFFFTPFLSTTWLASGHHIPQKKTAVARCIEECRAVEEEESPGLFYCAASCERRYSSSSSDSEWEPERDDESNHHHLRLRDSHRVYEQCRKQCEKGKQQQEQCKRQRQKAEELSRRERKYGNDPYSDSRNWRESEEEEEEQRHNPYYFHSQRFRYRLRSDLGHVKVLQRFSQKSHLLRGIDNYRLAILEFNPSTLLLPHHSDAETILVILKGKAVVTLVTHEKRESFKMNRGLVIRVPAGTTYYLINQDNVDSLQVALLIHPVNTPGQFREYYAAGGENPQSYYRIFSYDILERALNTPREQLHSLFQATERQQGCIKRVSQEQIKALTRHASSPRWLGRGSPTSPFELIGRKPLYSNNCGRFFEATPHGYQQLQEIEAAVTFTEINQGAMMVPHYNSKTTTVVLVVDGRGRFEMGCPRFSRGRFQESEREEEEEEEASSGDFQKIRANLSPGDVFIVPAGHPVALIAFPNEKLQTVGFGLNAMNNRRNFLAGKFNIMNQVEREAMEVAFNVPSRLIERIFSNNPKESYFVAGPEMAAGNKKQQQQQQRDEAGAGSVKYLPSIFEVANVF